MQRTPSLVIFFSLVTALLATGCGDDDRPADGGVDGGMADGSIDGMVPDGFVPDGMTPDGGGMTNPLFPAPTITECPGDMAPVPSEGLCTVTAGSAARLITADILTPGEVFRGGQVLVGEDGAIACVGCDCSGEAAAAGASTLVCPEAVLSPGLINAHDHITFGNTVPYDARGNFTDERYEHRHDWRRGRDEHTSVSSGGGRARTEEMQWLELRQVFSGTTSINGSGGPAGLLRNLDNAGRSGLPTPAADYSTFPLGDSDGTKLSMGCGYDYSDGADDATGPNAYAPHVAEGIDDAARNEFLCLREGDRDIVQENSAFIHGVGLRAADIAEMAVDGAKLIWSPRTNITLYGDTARVTEYARQGVTIAMGTDWIATGSMHMGRELACADGFNQNYLDGFFPDEQLWLMATRNGAIALGAEMHIGTIATGLQADLALYDGRENADHRAVLMADENDVALVMRGGTILYGDASIVDPLVTGCEAMTVCGGSKSVCLADIGSDLSTLQAANGDSYPLFGCNMPANEPSCVPYRDGMGSFPSPEVDGSNRYSGMSVAGDMDGDGIMDGEDNCMAIFNPIRPLDDGMQADHDMDGIGDACDPCPLGGDDDPMTCNAVDPNDRDADGVPNDMDNCPADPNEDQADADDDGLGDACDACPMRANPGGTACPGTVYEVNDGTFAVGQAVTLSDMVVTAIDSNGFFAQLDADAASFDSVDFSGLFFFTRTAPSVSLGDVVQASGPVAEFFGQLQLGEPTVTVTGSTTVPEPLLVNASDVVTGGPRESALRSVLLRVDDLVVADDIELTSADVFATVGGLRVGDGLVDLGPVPNAGDEIAFVVGPLHFGFENTRILPRSLEDLVYAALRVTPGDIRVLVDGTTEITVWLPEAAPVGGADVTVALAPADILTGPATITVPEGALSATAMYTGASTAQTGTLTISYGGDMAMANVEVTEPFAGGLIISEYVEGSSNNKALELYNGGTGGDVDLSACRLQRHTNGNASASATVDLSGMLAMGATHVLCNGSIDDDGPCDVTTSTVNHNGNDAWVLECDGMIIDTFGQANGMDTGPWTGGGLSTENRTLRRNCDAMPDTDVTDAFDPSTQWTGFDINTFDGLGSHCE